MPIIFDSFVVLVIVLLLARYIKRGSSMLHRYFIPSSLVGGIGALILGPQVLGTIPAEVMSYWNQLPKHLISVVFAGLLLGHALPGPREIWRQSGPMIAFGNTLAWGQYVVGILLTMLVLTPLFNAPPMTGALIEVSFEGGHGTAAGLAPTFEQLGWPEATDIALGLATVSIIVAIFGGVLLINLYNRKQGRGNTAEEVRAQQQRMIRSGYNLTRFANYAGANPFQIIWHILVFAISIGIGWFLLQGCIWLEEWLLAGVTDVRLFAYVPLFPLAMIGGLIVQFILQKTHKTNLLRPRVVRTISSIALDLLIVTAVATVSLSAIGDNIPIFIGLAIAGIVWIVFAFLFFAPKMFRRYWFEQGLTNTGQSMGMTATGLLLNRLVDPTNKSHAREGFAYKQLAFEPFMGGGIVTAGAAIMIATFGSVPVLIVVSLIFLFWIVVGIRLGRPPRRPRIKRQ